MLRKTFADPPYRLDVHIASMRPQRNAAENGHARVIRSRFSVGFNEAAA